MRRKPNQEHAAADWNARVAIGSEVEYRETSDTPPSRYKTSTPAEVMGGHTAVVWLHGKSGCVAISHCRPIGGAR